MSQNYEIDNASASGQALELLERESLAHHTGQVVHVQLHSPSKERRQEQATATTSPPAVEVRLVPLIAVLIVVTLGMILSLLFLASTRGTVQTPSIAALLAHLPPFHILLIGGLIVLSVSAFAVRTERPTPTPAVKEVARPKTSLPPQLTDLQQPHYQAHVELLLMRIFAKVLALPIEGVRGNSDFFLCGGDSDSLVVLLSEIERQFRIRLTPDDVFDHPVLFRLATVLVKKQLGARGREKKEATYR